MNIVDDDLSDDALWVEKDIGMDGERVRALAIFNISADDSRRRSWRRISRLQRA